MQPVREHVGETDRRINKRKIYHNKKDKDSHLPNHSRESQYTHVWKDDFKILNGNYKSGIQGKISETLYIRILFFYFKPEDAGWISSKILFW